MSQEKLKRIVFWKLKPNYKTIILRCTTIERFVNPPEFEVSNPVRMEDIFTMGSLVHEICHAIALGQDYSPSKKHLEVLRDTPQDYDDEEMFKVIGKRKKEAWWILWNIQRYKDILFDNDIIGNYKWHEQTMRIEIECSWYLVILQGTFDFEHTNGELWDYKTSAVLYTEEMVAKKRQKNYYTVLYNVFNDSYMDRYFNYLCLTKHKKAQSCVIKTHCDYEDSLSILKADLKSYLTYLASNGENTEDM